MFDKDKWGEIIQSLSAKPLRTVITAFGVFWGVFILILLLSASSGLENGVKRNFSGFAVNSSLLWGQSTSIEYLGFSSGRTIDMKNEDLSYLRNKFSDIKYITPAIWNMAKVKRLLKKGDYQIEGNGATTIKQLPYKLTKGRYHNVNDVKKRHKVAVLGTTVARELFGEGQDPVGEHILIGNANFLVIGVYKDNTGWNSEQNRIVIPYTTYQQIYNTGEIINSVCITAQKGVTGIELEKHIKSALKIKYKIHPDDEIAFGGYNLYQNFEEAEALFSVLKLVSYIVGVMILLSGIIGIMNIMLIVVKERTQEIGIKRAIGATPQMIITQILSESLVLTILAGMAGVILSTIISFIAIMILDSMPSEDLFYTNPSVDLSVVLVAFLILVLSGLVAGYIPAKMAIKVKPIDALREE